MDTTKQPSFKIVKAEVIEDLLGPSEVIVMAIEGNMPKIFINGVEYRPVSNSQGAKE